MTKARPKDARLADVIDAVRWDYDPEEAHLSPLVSATRYFRDFPWESEDVFDGDASHGNNASDGSASGGEDVGHDD